MPSTPVPEGVTPTEQLAVRAGAGPAVALPEGVAGLVWREITPADGAALAALVERIEEADNPPYRTSAEEVLEYFEDTHTWAGIGGWDSDAGPDTSGGLRAFGFVRVRNEDTTLLRAFCSGGVDPLWRHRGAGSAVLDWQVARGRRLLVDTGKEAPARIVLHVDEGMEVLAGLATARGFTPQRFYTEMRRDLSLPIPDVAMEGHLTVVPWSADLDDAVRRAHNRAFADHWGSQPHTPESWAQGRSHFAPEWSFVALDKSSDRSQVAGYLMSGRYEQDWPALGWTEGYTEMMGVLKEWRGRHVGTALMTRAMRAYKESGMQYAGLDVDTENPTGALTLYGKLGFEVTRTSAMYTIEI